MDDYLAHQGGGGGGGGGPPPMSGPAPAGPHLLGGLATLPIKEWQSWSSCKVYTANFYVQEAITEERLL